MSLSVGAAPAPARGFANVRRGAPSVAEMRVNGEPRNDESMRHLVLVRPPASRPRSSRCRPGSSVGACLDRSGVRRVSTYVAPAATQRTGEPRSALDSLLEVGLGVPIATGEGAREELPSHQGVPSPSPSRPRGRPRRLVGRSACWLGSSSPTSSGRPHGSPSSATLAAETAGPASRGRAAAVVALPRTGAEHHRRRLLRLVRRARARHSVRYARAASKSPTASPEPRRCACGLLPRPAANPSSTHEQHLDVSSTCRLPHACTQRAGRRDGARVRGSVSSARIVRSNVSDGRRYPPAPMAEPGIRKVDRALPWQAEIYDRRAQRRRRKHFRTLAEARAWRQAGSSSSPEGRGSPVRRPHVERRV